MRFRTTDFLFVFLACLFFGSCTIADHPGECPTPEFIPLESGTYAAENARMSQGYTDSLTIDVDLDGSTVVVDYVLDDGRQVVETYRIEEVERGY